LANSKLFNGCGGETFKRKRFQNYPQRALNSLTYIVYFEYLNKRLATENSS
jgi:hypothetical protein